MRNHGTQIMQAVILILEGDHSVEVKEQALCILANVADGDTAKDYIMGNEDMLKKLMSYMVSDVKGFFIIKNASYTLHRVSPRLENRGKWKCFPIQEKVMEFKFLIRK